MYTLSHISNSSEFFILFFIFYSDGWFVVSPARFTGFFPYYRIQVDFPHYRIRVDFPYYRIQVDFPYYRIQVDFPYYKVQVDFPYYRIQVDFPYFKMQVDFPYYRTQVDFPHYRIQVDFSSYRIHVDFPYYRIQVDFTYYSEGWFSVLQNSGSSTGVDFGLICSTSCTRLKQKFHLKELKLNFFIYTPPPPPIYIGTQRYPWNLN